MRSWKLQLVLIPLLLCGTLAHAAEQTVIIYTARADGRIENCRCPSDPYGALDKRLPEINRMRELGSVLLLDAGGFFPQLRDTLAIPFLLQAYELHEYDAITIGPQEMIFGSEWVRTIEQTLPIVSANVRHRDGTPVGKQALVIVRGDEKFAVTGITTRTALKQLGPGVYENFSLLEIDQALEQAFADVPDDARRIVLAQAPMDEIREMKEQWDGISLVIGGLNSDLIDGVEFLNKTGYVQVGAKSRYMGFVRFKGLRIKADLVPIQTHLPDDPRIAEIALELRKERVRNRPEIHY
jgi:2',3'-cyclic-nucleotide 2'-phosphodiesterase (5'-nucleotidase family)